MSQTVSRLAALEKELLKTHQLDDSFQLVGLYQEAGQIKQAEGNIDAAAFYITHAYVFALESGHPAEQELRQFLVRHGREA